LKNIESPDVRESDSDKMWNEKEMENRKLLSPEDGYPQNITISLQNSPV